MAKIRYTKKGKVRPQKKKKKTRLQKNLDIIAHNERHGPSKEDLFEARAWGRATGWVNKRKEDVYGRNKQDLDLLMEKNQV